jgi:phospholipid/cholesterol/gamma-HCH transport system substrate-binding protein
VNGGFLRKARYELAGLVYIALLAMFVALTVALYNKAFTPVVLASVDTDKAGLQLLPHSDVKIRGLIVGEVKSIDIRGNDEARINIALQPDKVPVIPRGVSARLIPKTLFGEKFVDLVPPARDEGHGLKAGAVIPEDRSKESVEINQVLDDLMPVLNAVPPDKLNATLNAMATALDGRGAQIGHSIDLVYKLIPKLNRSMPDIKHDITRIGDVAKIANEAAPDVLRTLRNTVYTSRTIVAKRQTLATTLSTGIAVSDNATKFVSDNANRLVGVNIAGRDTLALLAKYAPEVPCVLQGLVKLKPRLEQALGGGQPGLHATVEIVKPRPSYKPGLDDPQYADHRGPRCYGLPNPKTPFPQYQMLDGTQDDQWYQGTGLAPGPSDARAQNKNLLDTAIGPATGTPSSKVPDISNMLFGPLADGRVVNVK